MALTRTLISTLNAPHNAGPDPRYRFHNLHPDPNLNPKPMNSLNLGPNLNPNSNPKSKPNPDPDPNLDPNPNPDRSPNTYAYTSCTQVPVSTSGYMTRTTDTWEANPLS